jgi:hypothetical protein
MVMQRSSPDKNIASKVEGDGLPAVEPNGRLTCGNVGGGGGDFGVMVEGAGDFVDMGGGGGDLIEPEEEGEETESAAGEEAGIGVGIEDGTGAGSDVEGVEGIGGVEGVEGVEAVGGVDTPVDPVKSIWPATNPPQFQLPTLVCPI